ncbi:hypothetical protein [Photobacterium damselae]|uniref:hypothetical protein n=1 Tax=Photobacterium damselae TaxID=38293 RepID=UPI001F1853CE|nr:hypothetical protein [Photobacterium damselae]UKA04490.1 hypothetical protein IHC89_22975 [Photobacterium damselae subsp. damselae]
MTISEFEQKKLTKQLGNMEELADEVESSASYRARDFYIKLVGNKYFPSEYCPTGTIFLGRNTSDLNNFDFSHKSLFDEYRSNPNNFETYCKDNNIKPDTVIKSGGGVSINSILYETLDEAINTIIEAIDNNVVLKSFYTTQETNAKKNKRTTN